MYKRYGNSEQPDRAVGFRGTREFVLGSPGFTTATQDISGTRIQPVRSVFPHGSDQSGIAPAISERHGTGEQGRVRAIHGTQILRLGPNIAIPREDAGTARIASSDGVVKRGSYQGGVPGGISKRDVKPEGIARRTVAGGEFLPLGPGTAAAGENIGTANIDASDGVGAIGSDQRGISSHAAQGQTEAEVVVGRTVTGGESLLLGPQRPAAGEDVGAASRYDGGGIVVGGTDDRDIAAGAAQGHRGAKLVMSGTARHRLPAEYGFRRDDERIDDQWIGTGTPGGGCWSSRDSRFMAFWHDGSTRFRCFRQRNRGFGLRRNHDHRIPAGAILHGPDHKEATNQTNDDTHNGCSNPRFHDTKGTGLPPVA